MRIVWTVALLGLGCGGETTPRTTGPCVERAGTYRQTYNERSGNCGPVSEGIFTIVRQPVAPDAPCTGTIGYSPDNCRVTLDVTCPSPDGHKLTQRGTVDWSRGAGTGNGTLQHLFYKPDGSLSCSSTYDISIVRQ